MRELKLDIEALYSKAAAGPYEYSILVEVLREKKILRNLLKAAK